MIHVHTIYFVGKGCDSTMNEALEQWDDLVTFLRNNEIEKFREYFLLLHPYDQGQFFMEQSYDDRHTMYTYLSAEEIASMLEHMDSDERVPYVIEMDPRFAAIVFEQMAVDDAVDLLNKLDTDKIASYLTIMNQEAAKEIKHLLHYEEKTAGSIMTTSFVAFYKDETLKEVMNVLKQEAPAAETIYYLYILDDDKTLVGVLSLRDLIVADERVQIEEVMNEQVVSVSAGKDQEEVAQMMRDYNFLAVPVVDFQDHLLGIITADDIMDVMDEEASDDYSKLAAVSDEERSNDSAIESAKKRLPWLIILLFLGMFTASLIGKFEETLEQVAVLAIFIPLIAGMAGNTGTQSLAVAVRGIATGDYGKQGKFRLLLREATTGLITGSVCGLLIVIIIFIWKGQLFLGILVGISILATLTVATLSGSVIPIFMDKMKIDPAVASGPFITTINDIISILIYFGIATTFMQYLI